MDQFLAAAASAANMSRNVSSFSTLEPFSAVSTSDTYDQTTTITTTVASKNILDAETLYSTIDEATFKMARFAFSVILYPTAGIVGTISNFFALVVLIKQGSTHSSSVSIINMGVADMLCSALLLCVYTDGFIGDFDSPSVQAFLKIRDEVIYPIRAAVRHVSTFCVPFMAFERFVAIYFPFAAARIFSRRKTIIVFLCLWIFCFSFYIPTNVIDRTILVPVGTTSEEDNTTNASNSTNIVYQLAVANWYVYTYFIINPLLWQVMPYAVTSFFSVSIGLRLRQSAKWRKEQQQAKTNEANKQSARITKVILSLMVLFLISQLPYNYLCLKCFLEPFYCVNTRTRDFMFHRYWISFVGSTNYTTTFFVYLIGNARFRKTFLDIFLPCCRPSISSINNP